EKNKGPRCERSAHDEVPHKDYPNNGLDSAGAREVARGEGDESAMNDFAEQQTVDALNDYGMPSGSSWKQTESDSCAGSTFVTYENADDGTKVELRIGNEAASNGQPQAVKEAKFT